MTKPFQKGQIFVQFDEKFAETRLELMARKNFAKLAVTGKMRAGDTKLTEKSRSG
jgi:hypothetical protein